MKTELEKSIKVASEWNNVGGQLMRTGIGLFGQEVQQGTSVDGKSYYIAETFQTTKRYTSVGPSYDDPNKLVRSVDIVFADPAYSSAMRMQYNHRYRVLTLAIGMNQGPVQYADLFGHSGEKAAVKLEYGKRRLDMITMRADDPPAVTSRDIPLLKWEAAMSALLQRFDTIDPRIVQIDKEREKRDVEALIQTRYDPEGDAVKAARVYAYRAGDLVIDRLSSQFPRISEAILKLPFAENMVRKALFSIESANKFGDNWDERLQASLDNNLKDVANAALRFLISYTAEEVKRVLTFTDLTPAGFVYSDKSVRSTYQVVDGQNSRTHQIEPQIHLVDGEEPEQNGVGSYRERLVVGNKVYKIRPGINISGEGNNTRWTVDGIPLILPVTEIVRAMNNITGNAQTIRDLLPIQADFRIPR